MCSPGDIVWVPNNLWGDQLAVDGNGYAHVRSALIGTSFTVPVEKGRLVLGTWQQIILIDFDNNPRQRRVVAQFVGS